MATHPIHMKFYLTRQQLLSTDQVHGSIGSPMFSLRTPQAIEYNVNVFPNGRNTVEAGRFLAFLQFRFPNQNMQLSTNFRFIIGEGVDRSFNHRYEKSSSFGGILCARQQLFSPACGMANDRLAVELTGSVTIEKQQATNQNGNVRPAFVYPNRLPQPSPTNLSYRMPVPPRVIHKIAPSNTASPSTTTTEMKIAQILESAVQEEQSKRLESLKDNGKMTDSVAGKHHQNDENKTPKTAQKPSPANSKRTESVRETIATVPSVPAPPKRRRTKSTPLENEAETATPEATSIVREPSKPKSIRKRSISSTEKADAADPTTSVVLPPIESSGKRLRTRTARYVDYVVDDDEIGDGPVVKKGRRSADGANDYVPPRGSKLPGRPKKAARISNFSRRSVPETTEIEYDGKIEGLENDFDINTAMISQKSKTLEQIFALNENVISLEAIPDKTIEIIVNFCHGIPLKEMTNKEVFNAMFYAGTFEIFELKKFLEDKLRDKLAASNAADIANAALLADSIELGLECKNFMIEHRKKEITIRNFATLDDAMKAEVLSAIEAN